MREVAIVYYKDHDSYECYEHVATSITNWQEVTDEDFWALAQYATKIPAPLGWYARVICRQDVREFKLTLEAALVHAKKLKADEEERQKRNAETRMKKAANKLLRDKEAFERLKQKFEPVVEIGVKR